MYSIHPALNVALRIAGAEVLEVRRARDAGRVVVCGADVGDLEDDEHDIETGGGVNAAKGVRLCC